MKHNIDELMTTAKDLELPLDGPLGYLATYLSGVYHQGTGNLGTALRIFRDNKFDLPPLAQTTLASSAVQQFERDISLLAALNSVWILQAGSQKNTGINTALIARLQPFCEISLNQDIRTAFSLIVATTETNPVSPLYEIKNHLKQALLGSQETSNTLFLGITLNVMCNKFFSNVVGLQAEKSAMAASHQAQRTGNALWKSVAEGMLAEAYEVNGKKEPARAARSRAQQYTKELRMAQTSPKA